MITITDVDLELNPRRTLQRISEDHKPVLVTHNDMPTYVIMEYDDFASEIETNFFMNDPVLRSRLLQSIEQLKLGKTVSVSLEELRATWADEA